MVGRVGDQCPRDDAATGTSIAWTLERGQCTRMYRGVLKMTRLPGR
jgi:hypothetical protein